MELMHILASAVGFLKASLAAVIGQCRRRFAKVEVREDVREGWCKGDMMKIGALSVLVILIYSTVYTMKSPFPALKLKGLFTEPGTKDRGWDIRRQKGGVEKLYSMVSYQI